MLLAFVSMALFVLLKKDGRRCPEDHLEEPGLLQICCAVTLWSYANYKARSQFFPPGHHNLTVGCCITIPFKGISFTKNKPKKPKKPPKVLVTITELSAAVGRRSALQPRHSPNLLLRRKLCMFKDPVLLGMLAERRGERVIVGEQMCRALLPRAGSAPRLPAPGAAIVLAGPYSSALGCRSAPAPSLFLQEISIKNPSQTPTSLNCR